MKKSFKGQKFYSNFEKAAQVLCCLIEPECAASPNWGQLCFQVFGEHLNPSNATKEVWSQGDILSPDEFIESLCTPDDELVKTIFNMRYPKKFEYYRIVGRLACSEIYTATMQAFTLSNLPIPESDDEEEANEED